MNCDSTQRELLHLGWDKPARERMASVLGHLRECQSCQDALNDYDQLRVAIRLSPEEVEPPDGWSAFEDRLRSVAVAGPARRWGWVQRFSLAASIMLALAGWWMYWQAGRQTPVRPMTVASVNGMSAPIPAMSSQELIDRVRAFREVSELFEHRADWVLVSEQASDLGLSSAPAGTGDRLLLMRLVVSRGKDILSSADLMILPGRTAEVAVPSKKGLELRYQIATSADSPRDLQIWVELKQGQGAQAASILATDLKTSPGKLIPVGQMATSSGRYDVSVEMCPAELQAQS